MRRILIGDVLYYPTTPAELTAWRNNHGLSVDACAEYVYYDPKTWRLYENGKAKIPRAVWELLHYKITGRPPQTPKKPTLKGPISCLALSPLTLSTTL